MLVGLVHDRGGGWEPPDFAPEPPEEPARRVQWNWRPRWRPLAWLAVWCWLMTAVPIVSRVVNPAVGYGVLMLAVALGFWRLDRWLARQYWHGLREYKT